jgi:hypothetical protein
LNLSEGETARIGNRVSVDAAGVALIMEPTVRVIYEDPSGQCRTAILLSHGDELCEPDGTPVERTDEVRAKTRLRVYRREGDGCYLVEDGS